MKERKQVFALSGVTVPEAADDLESKDEDDDDDDSIFGSLVGGGGAEDEVSKGGQSNDNASEKAVMGFRNTSSTTTEIESSQHQEEEPIPGIIDLTDVVEETPGVIQDWKEDTEEPAAIMARKKSAIAELTLTLNQALREEEHCSLETTTAAADAAEEQEEYDESDDPFSPTTAAVATVIADMRATKKQLDDHCETSFERLNYDEDDDDDMHSVTSVRSLCSAFFPSSPTRKEETRIQANRRLLIQSLESTFPKHIDPNERYTITSLGRAGLDPPKLPKNEYFTAYTRMQRSRLSRELSATVSLLSTRNFHVVEGGQTAATPAPAPSSPPPPPRTPPSTTVEEQEEPAKMMTMMLLQDQQSEHDSSIKFISPINTNSVSSDDGDDNDHDDVDESPSHKIPQEEIETKTTTGGIHDLLTALSFGSNTHTEEDQEQQQQQQQPVVVVEETSRDQEQVTLPTTPSSQPKSSQETQNKEDATTMPAAPTTAQIGDHDHSSADAPTQEAKVFEPAAQQPQQPQIVETAAQVALHTTEEVIPTTPTTESAPPTADGNDQAEQTLLKGTEASETARNTPTTEQSAQPQDTTAVPPTVSSAAESPSSNNIKEESPSQGGKKKSKASKWKDRLAKRKSVTIQDSSAADSPPQTDEPSKPPLPPQTPPALDSPSALEPCDSPSEDFTPRGRRKSLKWKQRLANKRESKSSGDGGAEQNEVDSSSSATAISEEKKEDHVNDTPELPPVPVEETPESSVLPSPAAKEAATCANENEVGPASELESKEASTPPATMAPTKASADEKLKINLVEEPQAPSHVQVTADATESENPPVLHNELRNSFMAFDALLQQRLGGADLPVDDGDDYSEYTIEESVLGHVPPSKATSLLKGTQEVATADKSFDNETQYDEITVEQSFMELTVEETVDDNNMSSQYKPSTTPIHHATVNLMSSRMFNTPQIAKEPTITVQHLSDDEMTQLTFDQSYVEPSAKKAPPTAPPTTIERKPPSDLSAKASSNKGTPNGSMHGSRNDSGRGSRKLGSSVTGSHRSATSKGGASASSDKNNKLVSDLLRKDIWSKDAKVVEEAMGRIVNEASRGSKYRAKIVQCGGVMGIVRAMEAHPDAAPVQVNACAALDRMAMDPDTQVIISEMGGIAAILDAMKKFEVDGDVHQAACSALANITRHRGATDEAEGAVQVLCASMSRHSTNMMVQAKAFGTIANLCMDNKLRLKELSDAGGMLAMTLALQQPWPSKTEKHEAISNLSILLRCLAEHEEGAHDEEYEGYHEQNDDLMSVVSGLDDDEEGSAEPTKLENDEAPADEAEASPTAAVHKTELGQAAESVEPALPEGECPVKDKAQLMGLEQGSNSTQPTVSTSRESDDENCIIS